MAFHVSLCLCLYFLFSLNSVISNDLSLSLLIFFFCLLSRLLNLPINFPIHLLYFSVIECVWSFFCSFTSLLLIYIVPVSCFPQFQWVQNAWLAWWGFLGCCFGFVFIDFGRVPFQHLHICCIFFLCFCFFRDTLYFQILTT